VCRILGRAPLPVRLTYNVRFAFTFQCIFIKRSYGANRTCAGWKRCRTRLTNAYARVIPMDTKDITIIYNICVRVCVCLCIGANVDGETLWLRDTQIGKSIITPLYVLKYLRETPKQFKWNTYVHVILNYT